LEEGLKLAKRQGYAISRGEIFVGPVAVSSPYYDHRGSVVGSVGLYGPNARVSDDKVMEFGKLVCEAGQKLSTLLGFQAPEGINLEPEVARSKEPLKSNVRRAVNLRSK
jgi:IclR family acetate operon transcriptional repressor